VCNSLLLFVLSACQSAFLSAILIDEIEGSRVIIFDNESIGISSHKQRLLLAATRTAETTCVLIVSADRLPDVS